MKQSTLNMFGKRPKADDPDSPETAKRAKSETDDTSSAIDGDPLAVRPSNFVLDEIATMVEPQVIKREPDLDLLFFKKFIKGPDLFNYLLEELPWYRVKYTVRGININTPRFTCVWGCDETGSDPKAYKIAPRPIPKALKDLLGFVEERTGAHYNFVLCNYYSDGKDSISWHSDDENFLGPLPCIASLSLGSNRDFLMKHKTDRTTPQEKWSLASGDMVVMRGKTQSKWLHSIPKRAHATGRMNLTFRRAMTVGGTNNYYHYNVGTGPVHRWRQGQMVEIKSLPNDKDTTGG